MVQSDVSLLLTQCGVPAQYVAAIFMCIGVLAHVLPYLPKPTGGAYGAVYGVASFLAGNYLNSANKPDTPVVPPSSKGN